MKEIEHKDQLISNIETVENLLTEGSKEEYKIVGDLIRKGRCFVAYKIGSELRFAPSRFLGYADNNLSMHEGSDSKDGKRTNPLINRILESKLNTNHELEEKYIRYCENLGVKPSNYKKRRYWYLEIEKDFNNNLGMDELFPEGKIIERIHKSRERNPKVISIAKQNFKAIHGRIYCQVCGFDFEKVYGEIGEDFIEGHHTIPVSLMGNSHKTSLNDIALLCSNCHRMVHKKRPWLSMLEINLLIKK